MKALNLEVVSKREESSDTVSIVFSVPDRVRSQLDYKPGQFITVQFEKDGRPIRRAYSLSSCPYQDDFLQITVKRIDGGLVSNHIHDHVQVGDTVRVLAAAGKFFAEISDANYRTYYLFAAGSGITPLFSILRSVLVREPKSHVHLLYGNRNKDSIIFCKSLEQIESQFGERIKVVHAFSRSNRNAFSAMWSQDGIDRKVRKGRIDEEMIRWFFKEHPPVAQDAQYFICGPGSMIESVEMALRRIGVPKDRIRTERFATNVARSQEDKSICANAELTVRIGNQNEKVCHVSQGQTLLRAMLECGADIPYSCESGVCGTCKARLVAGNVHMASYAALTQKEVDGGTILTCQAKPKSEQLEIRIDSPNA